MGSRPGIRNEVRILGAVLVVLSGGLFGRHPQVGFVLEYIWAVVPHVERVE